MSKMAESILIIVIAVLIGVYCIAAAVYNWEFFFTNRRARPLVGLLGRNGARIFYGGLGAFIIFAGIMAAVGSP